MAPGTECALMSSAVTAHPASPVGPRTPAMPLSWVALPGLDPTCPSKEEAL